MLARAVQGVATSAATGAVTAGLVDFQAGRNPRLAATVNGVSTTLGLAAGALGSGLLVQYAPMPTTLVHALLIAVFLITTSGVALMPETVARRPGAWRSHRPRVAVPGRIRPHFLLSTPSLVALWALGGFHLSLGPALTATVLHAQNVLVAGVVVGILTASGALGSFTLRRREPRGVLVIGSVALAAGMVVTLVGVAAGVPAAYLVGTAVAGYGCGAFFLGAFGALAPLAAPEERASLFSTVYVVSYLAFGIPAIAAGVASTAFGLRATAVGHAAALIVLAGSVLVGLAVRGRGGETGREA